MIEIANADLDRLAHAAQERGDLAAELELDVDDGVVLVLVTILSVSSQPTRSWLPRRRCSTS